MKIMSMTVLAGLGALTGAVQAELVYGITQNQTLVRFDSQTPGTIIDGWALQGLLQNEQIRGIDFRPSTDELWGVSSFSRLYTINVNTGVATFANVLSVPLSGSSFGVDFNPVVDRLRIVSDADQNLRVDVSSGAAIIDGTLGMVTGDTNIGINPNVSFAAYTNSLPGATSTQLFVIDSGLDVLMLQNPANSGGLATIGSLGRNITPLGGFDISGGTGTAYLAAQDFTESRSMFFRVNLTTGAVTTVGEVGGGLLLTGIAVVPTPGTAALLAVGGLAALRRRR